MGGKSKKQTIGYKYYLGMHQVLCHGPIDAVTKATVDDRTAWAGSSAGGSITVSAESLFGGDAREGGVSGTLDIMMGGLAQGQNSYLVGQLGDSIPAYRGVVSIVFRQCYLGNNPYLKPWRFRGQRIHKRQNDVTQWYDEASEIRSGGGEGVAWQDPFTYANTAALLAQWTEYDPGGRFVWTLDTHPSTGQPSIRCQVLNNMSGTFNTTLSRSIGGLVPGAIYNVRGSLYAVGPSTQPNNVLLPNWLNYNAVANSSGQVVVSIPIQRFGGTGVDTYYWIENIRIIALGSSVDMNPAHMIRECLTDPDWGMGYLDSDIDDTTFESAADRLLSEGLGMSLLWDKSITIDAFIQEVVKHIDAALYVSRSTGKFCLKLIRADYNEATLLHLDESNIARIEDPSRASFGELTNSVTVNYWDAMTGKDASLTVTDTALVQVQGAVINAPVQYPGFTNARNATIAGQRDLRTLSTPLLACTVYANGEAKNLNVGDVFKLSWKKWQIANVVMRITGIAIGNGKSNQVKLTCVQDSFSTVTSIVISTPPANEWQDPSEPPGASTQQLAQEAPYYEIVQVLGQADTDNKLLTRPEIGYILAAASRAGSAINARMWSDNGDGYEDTGALDFSPSAVLDADITKTQTSFIVSDAQDLDEVVLGTHFQIGDELIRIDAIDAGTGELTVGRGVLDTVPQLHSAGDLVMFWDQYAGFDPTEYVEGEEVDVKITPISGAGVYPLEDAVAMPVVLDHRAARPYAPGDLRINGDSYVDAFYDGLLTISWKHRDRLQQTSGTLVDHTAGDIGPEALTKYRIQIYVDNVLTDTYDDIDANTYDVTPSGVGFIKVEVHAKRVDTFSWQAPSHEFYYGGDIRLTEDGDIRVTEDGDTRILED